MNCCYCLHSLQPEEESKEETKKAKPKSYKFDSEDSESEEVILSRRPRDGGKKGRLSKKASRALDSGLFLIFNLLPQS